MEPTPNFAAGLQKAHDELLAEGKLKKEDGETVKRLLANPVATGKNGKRVHVMYRVHVRTRSMYAKLNNAVIVANLDWTKLVAWLKEHWVEVVRTILSVLLFLI